MKALTAFVFAVALGLTMSAIASPAVAGDWTVGIGVSVPGVVVVPGSGYQPPPAYYVPAPPPEYVTPPPYYAAPYPPQYVVPPTYGWHYYHHWRRWRHHHHDDDDDD